jgi:hypothetical protein
MQDLHRRHSRIMDMDDFRRHPGQDFDTNLAAATVNIKDAWKLLLGVIFGQVRNGRLFTTQQSTCYIYLYKHGFI